MTIEQLWTTSNGLHTVRRVWDVTTQNDQLTSRDIARRLHLPRDVVQAALDGLSRIDYGFRFSVSPVARRSACSQPS